MADHANVTDEEIDSYRRAVEFADGTSTVVGGRRTVSTTFDCAATVAAAAVVEFIAAASVGLDDVEITFGGETENVGEYGYGGEVEDYAELSSVTLTVTGNRALTAQERSFVAEIVTWERTVAARVARTGPATRQPAGRLRI